MKYNPKEIKILSKTDNVLKLMYKNVKYTFNISEIKISNLIVMNNLKTFYVWVKYEYEYIDTNKVDLYSYRYKKYTCRGSNYSVHNHELINNYTTKGCIVGWYTTLKTTNDNGLVYNTKFCDVMYITNDKRYYGWSALSMFFNISIEDCIFIFSLGSYEINPPNKYMIIEKIDCILSKK